MPHKDYSNARSLQEIEYMKMNEAEKRRLFVVEESEVVEVEAAAEDVHGVPHHRQEEVQLAAPLLPLGLISSLCLASLSRGQVGALWVVKYVFELKHVMTASWRLCALML